MRIELWIIIITALFIFNAYYDNYFFNIYKSYKKYIQILFYAFIAFSIYYILKTNSKKSKQLLFSASNLLKFLPIDRNAMHLINPVINNCSEEPQNSSEKIMSSGKTSNKRSVSETKKKWVASHQNWKCLSCGELLPAWFEVDHKIRLADGGTNDVDNLVAYCRSCHGKKTMMENF
jgi:5-methylcytosine-specific restriction endonuclease McrA